MIRAASEAAEYVVARLEQRLDDRFGRSLRKRIGRYLAALTFGIPIAYAVPGFRWSSDSTYGLIAGLLLYAAVDCARARSDRRADDE